MYSFPYKKYRLCDAATTWLRPGRLMRYLDSGGEQCAGRHDLTDTTIPPIENL